MKFKTTYDREKYLDLVDLPFSFRRLFCAFKISCHDLEIERQRYRSPRIVPDQRICKICQLEPETEEHFVLFCPKYKNLRMIMFQEIMRCDPGIQCIVHNDRFAYLMCSQILSTVKAVMVFLNSAMIERKFLLSGQLLTSNS